MLSLCDDIVQFCTMISKLCLGYGIIEFSRTQCGFHPNDVRISTEHSEDITAFRYAGFPRSLRFLAITYRRIKNLSFTVKLLVRPFYSLDEFGAVVVLRGAPHPVALRNGRRVHSPLLVGKQQPVLQRNDCEICD